MDAGQGRPIPLDAFHAAALCAGVVAQLLLPGLLPPAVAVAGLCLSALAIPCFRQRRALTLGAGLLLGAALCALHGHAALAGRLPAGLDGQRVVLEGRVLGLPESARRGSSFGIEVERVVAGLPGAGQALEGRRLDLRWYGGGQELRPGERWRWSVRLAALTGPMNPGDPDPARRALVDRTVGTGQVVARARPLRLGSAGGLHALRDAASAQVVDALGAERARFVAALAVGDTRGLSDADWERLREFGLTHLIAISGFHVGMVAGVGVLLVRGLWWLWPTLAHRWRRPQAAAFAATVVAIGYAGLAGFSLPTVRTVLMVAAVAAVVGLRLRTPPAQALLLTVVLIVLVDPFAVLTPGFWLSCGGVAWLMWCLPGISNPWDLHAFLKAQWVATLGLLPFAAAFFLQVPVAGPLANLVAIPWISLVVVPLSLLGTLASLVSDTLASGLWWLAAGAMALLWNGLDAVPPALAGIHWLPAPSVWSVALAVPGVAIALLPRGLPWRHAGWVLLLPLLFPRVPVPAPGEVALTVFALPRGDALLLRTAGQAVLVDAGPEHVDLARTLRAIGVERIDLRIETRGNAGRRGGVAAVDAAFPPRAVWQGPGRRGGQRCEAGRRWQADGVVVEALSPAVDGGGNEPDHACVLRVLDGRGRLFWLASEAGPWVARRLSHAVGALPAGTGEATWVIGAPASLAAWQSTSGATGGIATRAPGPSLSRRWPDPLLRVDRTGALTWGAELHRDAGPRRWWHPALQAPAR